MGRFGSVACVVGMLAVGGDVLGSGAAWAQGVPTFGGNAQHTSVYAPSARRPHRIRWSADIDRNNSGAFAHYGAPVVTDAGTVVVPVKTETNGFEARAFDGATGAAKYVLGSDYILPKHNWIPVYNPALAKGPTGARLWYPGAGGTVFHVDNPDSDSPGAPVRHVFYTDLAGYAAGAAGYNTHIFVDTPLTTDSQGAVYFGFRVQGTAPAPLSTTQSGYARIAPDGAATYIFANAAAGDSRIGRDSHNAAPALSQDESTLYVVVKSPSTDYFGYLVALDAKTLAPRHKVFLTDPRNGKGAGILDDSTASPMVAPDGDVYLGIFGNPYNGSRGFLSRFSADLSISKTPGGFGWDYTPAIVPSSMVPDYTGSSPYLIFAKYNNYAIGDGDGVNRIALLDPNATQIDPRSSAGGLVTMREVRTVISPTPDPEHIGASYPHAAREWCINAPAVNPATGSIFVPCEDGRFYRWDLATNTLTGALPLNPGIGQPYVPTVIGPDGTIFTLNGGNLFALDDFDGVSVDLVSSAPDLRHTVVGDTLTFTATVQGGASVPTGQVVFTDVTFQGTTRVETTLGAALVDPLGRARLTTSLLAAGGANLGTHFITATYAGDANHPAGSATILQKVHPYGSVTRLQSSVNPVQTGMPVVVTVGVSGGGPVRPTGMVTLFDGAAVLGQAAVDSTGTVAFTVSFATGGVHPLRAVYASDTLYADSAGTLDQVVASDRATETTLTASPSPSLFAQSVTFTAQVRSLTSGTPTGSFTFSDGASVLASGVPIDFLGRATYRTSVLSVGTHPITARFVGTGGWLESVGAVDHRVDADTVAPSAPTNLTAISAPVPRAILLRWGASRDNVRVAFYEVWRALDQNGTFVRVSTVTGTGYIDLLPSRGAVRWYTIVAVDPSGNRSAPSAKVQGTSL